MLRAMTKQPFTHTKRGPLNLTNRVIWSLDGWRDAWAREGSLRSWVYAVVISDIAAFALPLTSGERLFIVVLWILILASELMNTAIERLCDLVEPGEDQAIRAAKDAGSAAVALTAIAGGVAWVWVLVGLA